MKHDPVRWAARPVHVPRRDLIHFAQRSSLPRRKLRDPVHVAISTGCLRPFGSPRSSQIPCTGEVTLLVKFYKLQVTSCQCRCIVLCNRKKSAMYDRASFIPSNFKFLISLNLRIRMWNLLVSVSCKWMGIIRIRSWWSEDQEININDGHIDDECWGQVPSIITDLPYCWNQVYT